MTNLLRIGDKTKWYWSKLTLGSDYGTLQMSGKHHGRKMWVGSFVLQKGRGRRVWWSSKVWSGSDGWLWKEIMNNFTKFVKEIWFQGRVLMGLLPLINPPFQRNSGSIWDCFQTFKAWLERMSCGRRSPGIWTPAFVKISNI